MTHDNTHDNDIKDDAISSLYQGIEREESPAHVDEAILLLAKKEVDQDSGHHAHPVSPFSGKWPISASLVAILIIAFGLVTFIDMEAPQTFDELSQLPSRQRVAPQQAVQGIDESTARRLQKSAPSTQQPKMDSKTDALRSEAQKEEQVSADRVTASSAEPVLQSQHPTSMEDSSAAKPGEAATLKAKQKETDKRAKLSAESPATPSIAAGLGAVGKIESAVTSKSETMPKVIAGKTAPLEEGKIRRKDTGNLALEEVARPEAEQTIAAEKRALPQEPAPAAGVAPSASVSPKNAVQFLEQQDKPAASLLQGKLLATPCSADSIPISTEEYWLYYILDEIINTTREGDTICLNVTHGSSKNSFYLPQNSIQDQQAQQMAFLNYLTQSINRLKLSQLSPAQKDTLYHSLKRITGLSLTSDAQWIEWYTTNHATLKLSKPENILK